MKVRSAWKVMRSECEALVLRVGVCEWDGKQCVVGMYLVVFSFLFAGEHFLHRYPPSVGAGDQLMLKLFALCTNTRYGINS